MPAGGQWPPGEPAPREARDVVAFGQEVGRALSDGRIVGRAEPFAKVFPSSRAVKRAVGAVAWMVLEDIALEARIDDAGRLVSETNVRQIAENLALNKDTVTRHLARLREHGFVLQEEARGDASGRWEPCRYVLDPSACVERFTTTPPARNRRSAPCPKSSDTASGAASENTGHGDTGHGESGHPREHRDAAEQHAARAEARTRAHGGEPAVGDPGGPAPAAGSASAVPAGADADADDPDCSTPAGDGALPAPPAEPGKGDGCCDADGLQSRLVAAGVAGHVAADLVAGYPPQRIEQALAVATARSPRNPAGWIVTALRDGWDLSDRLAELQLAEARRGDSARLQRDQAEQARANEAERQRAEAWAQAVSAALDDRQLAAAVHLVTAAAPPPVRRSLAAVRGQLLAWAAAACRRFDDQPLPAALALALARGLDLREEAAGGHPLPEPPQTRAPQRDLRSRLTTLLADPPSGPSIAKGTMP